MSSGTYLEQAFNTMATARAAYWHHHGITIQAASATGAHTKQEAKTAWVQALRSKERLANYQPRLEGRYQCPDCWIDHGRRAAVEETASLKGYKDFRCKLSCGFQDNIAYSVSAGPVELSIWDC
jgi:hypothetical protein